MRRLPQWFAADSLGTERVVGLIGLHYPGYAEVRRVSLHDFPASNFWRHSIQLDPALVLCGLSEELGAMLKI